MTPNGTPPTTLSGEEVAARIKAARFLRGMRQVDLANALQADGLAHSLVGALERHEIAFRPVHRRALSEALRLPERWFMDPVDELCPEVVPEPLADRLARIEEVLAEIREGLR